MFALRNFAKLIVAAVGLFPQGVLGADDLNEQLIREARAVLTIAIGDEDRFFKLPGARCALDTSWPKIYRGTFGMPATSEIPDALARQYLNLRAHGTLYAPDVDVTLQQLLDPKNQHATAFCSEDERRTFIVEHRGKVESGEDEDFVTSHETLSFPVFDDDFRNAVIIVISSWGVFHNHHGGVPGIINCAAEVYSKENGVWRLVKSETLCET
jgi:hypothetical protein